MPQNNLEKEMTQVLKNSALSKVLKSVAILLIIYVAYKLIVGILNRALNRGKFKDDMVLKTVSKLLENVLIFISVFIALIQILDIFGVNTASILTAAGVGGVAIGFGAQSLVKDVITGFFILVEGQFYVGELIQINGDILGTVIEFGMRSTKVKDFNDGAMHIIPNGSITHVKNMSRGSQNANVTLNVPLKYELEEIMKILNETLKPLEKQEEIIKGPQAMGVSAINENYYSIFISTEVQNGNMYSVQRKIRQKIMDEFDRRNIVLQAPINLIKEE